ncbi:putative mbtF [Mycobacterium avium MAV_061107_1842]|nr:putative mbtF [Mycobacterium avium MAV_061107_1842]
MQIVPSRVELPWRSVTASPAEVPMLETASDLAAVTQLWSSSREGTA